MADSLSKKAALKIIIGGAVIFALSLAVLLIDLLNLYSKANNSLCSSGQSKNCDFGPNVLIIHIGQALFLLGLVVFLVGIVLYGIKVNQDKK